MGELHEVEVPMRDGTILRTNVHLPDPLPADGAPALVTRTAYGKDTGVALTADVAGLVAAGFAVVVQDKRGLYASDGEYAILRGDRADGHDTVEWTAAQPWCDGQVAVFGLSYLGHTAMSAAIEHPPHLRAAVVMQPATDEYTDRTLVDGVLWLQNDVDWPVLPFIAPSLIATLPEAERPAAEAELAAFLAAGEDRYRTLPLNDWPYFRHFPSLLQGPLEHREDAAYFAENRVGAAELAQVRVPILHVGSWFDFFTRNTVRQFELAAAHAPSGASHRLVMGAWAHSQLQQDSVAGLGFPDSPTDATAFVADWARRWIPSDPDRPDADAAPDVLADWPRAIVYVLGANRWRAEPSWPIPGTETRALALQPDGSASFEPALPGERAFAYDPAHPYTAPHVSGGPQDVTNHLGAHALAYDTAVLTEPLEITGWPRAVLHASTTGTDADWLVELQVVDAAGIARLVDEGIARGRYRHGRSRPRPTTPGIVEELTVHLRPISIELQPGERLRVVVTGGKFPAYERHPGAFVDLNAVTEADFVASTRTIASGSGRSRIELPILPPAARGEWIEHPWPLG